MAKAILYASFYLEITCFIVFLSVKARNNYSVMNKWEQIFPKGVNECISEYFRRRASWSPKFDPRFPNENQTKNCFINYVDYQRCLKLRGADHKDCDYFNQVVKSLCPEQWVEKYTEQLETQSFPVDI